MTTWGDFERWSKEKPWAPHWAEPVPGETLHNYLSKAVLTGNASLVVKALLAALVFFGDPGCNEFGGILQTAYGRVQHEGFDNDLCDPTFDHWLKIAGDATWLGSFADRQTDFYARDPGVDVSDWDVYRFNDLRGPTSLWHYTESEASGDESEADDASHATGSTQ